MHVYNCIENCVNRKCSIQYLWITSQNKSIQLSMDQYQLNSIVLIDSNYIDSLEKSICYTAGILYEYKDPPVKLCELTIGYSRYDGNEYKYIPIKRGLVNANNKHNQQIFICLFKNSVAQTFVCIDIHLLTQLFICSYTHTYATVKTI